MPPHSSSPRSRPLPHLPPILHPDPFSTRTTTTRSTPYSHRDSTNSRDSDGLSEASSLTFTADGGSRQASIELARYKHERGISSDDDYGGKDGEDDDGGVGERERLVREGEVFDEASDPDEAEVGAAGARRGAAGGLGWFGAAKEARAKRHRLLLFLLLLLALTLSALVLTAILRVVFPVLFTEPLNPDGTTATAHKHRFDGKGLKKITVEELKNGTWYSEKVQLEWLAEAGDGVFSQRASDGSIYLTDLNKNTSSVLVSGDDVRDYRTDQQLTWHSFKVSPDMQYILFNADWQKQWRHSSLSSFFLHRISPPLTLPLTPSSASPSSSFSGPKTSLAIFAPTGHTVAFVEGNDVWVVEERGVDEAFGEEGKGGKVGRLAKGAVRVTNDGGAEVFNGVNDWVYEEEIFSSPLSLFFSPLSTHLLFLSLNETLVPTYSYPIYNSGWNGDSAEWKSPAEMGEGGADAYQRWVRMRYPKAGYPNPTVRVRMFDLEAYGKQPGSASRPSISTSDGDSDKPALSPSVLASLSTLTLPSSSAFPSDDVLVTEIAWVGADEALVTWTTRDQGVEKIGYFDVGATRAGGGEREGRVVRETDWVKKDGGWAEATQNMSPLLPPSSSAASPSSSSTLSAAPLPPKIPNYPTGYLDILPSPSGYAHLAFFSPPDAREPVWLTAGEWEIDGGVRRVDLERGFAYVLAARPSTERHLLRVSLPRSVAELDALRSKQASSSSSSPAQTGVEVEQLTKGGADGSGQQGYYGVSMSPGGGVYLLDYDGPDIPWQKLFKVDDPDYVLPLTLNPSLHDLDPLYTHAQISHSTLSIPADGVDPAAVSASGGKKGKKGETVEVNVVEMRPPMMDQSGRTKYPVLVQVYGGPSSQMVNTRWQRDWHHYLCVTHNFIILRIDGRGTGFLGRSFRTPIRGRLGELEASDVISAGREWAKRGYVDEARVSVWGWSFGGFLTSKIIEANSSVFSLGMAVAPVTDWRYYDSVYTERYMSTPELNPGGYRNSSITKMEGFSNADFALAHGTGDDNVHWENSANLIDRLTVAGISDYHFSTFIDSDHSMGTRNAYWTLMAWLEGILLEHHGKGGRSDRWKMTAGDRERERERERKRSLSS